MELRGAIGKGDKGTLDHKNFFDILVSAIFGVGTNETDQTSAGLVPVP